MRRPVVSVDMSVHGCVSICLCLCLSHRVRVSVLRPTLHSRHRVDVAKCVGWCRHQASRHAQGRLGHGVERTSYGTVTVMVVDVPR